MSDVPIPLRCAGRPTVGGLVVPHVSVVAAGKPVLGAVHQSKAMRCIVDGLCQICGEALGRPLVVIVPASQLADSYSNEAPLHPECARYSVQVCPMLNGRREVLRQSGRHIGTACDVDGCGCDGWVASKGSETPRTGEAPGEWFEVWLDDYAIAVNDRREVHGLKWLGEPRRVRSLGGAS